MAPQKHSPLCVAVIFTSPGFDKKLSKNPKIGMNDSSLLEYMSRRQLRFEEGGAVVLAVALVLVVLRCDEALDREVRRPLQHLLGRAPGGRCVVELRVAGREKCQMAVVDAANPLERFDRFAVASRDEISAAEIDSRSARDDRG